MKKNDVLLIIIVLVLGVLSYAVVGLMKGTSGNSSSVVIKHLGEVIKTYDFTENTDETFTYDDGEELNIVRIVGGKVYMSEVNCSDRICVKTGEISKPGEIIVCLPHKFTVEIVSKENTSELDDIAE